MNNCSLQTTPGISHYKMLYGNTNRQVITIWLVAFTNCLPLGFPCLSVGKFSPHNILNTLLSRDDQHFLIISIDRIFHYLGDPRALFLENCSLPENIFVSSRGYCLFISHQNGASKDTGKHTLSLKCVST